MPVYHRYSHLSHALAHLLAILSPAASAFFRSFQPPYSMSIRAMCFCATVTRIKPNVASGSSVSGSKGAWVFHLGLLSRRC